MTDQIPRIYIAGPMRGLPALNWPAFDMARDLLDERGALPISPADLDRIAGLEPGDDLTDEQLRYCLKRDCVALLSCHAVVMLPGYTDSLGAMAEFYLAKAAGIPIQCIREWEYRLDMGLAVHMARGQLNKLGTLDA